MPTRALPALLVQGTPHPTFLPPCISVCVQAQALLLAMAEDPELHADVIGLVTFVGGNTLDLAALKDYIMARLAVNVVSVAICAIGFDLASQIACKYLCSCLPPVFLSDRGAGAVECTWCNGSPQPAGRL